MQTTVEETDKHVVRLSVQVEPDEVARDLDRTYRKLAGQARKGDYVLADVRAYVNDRDVPEASRQGFLSEVGSEELVPELDKELEGKRKGDILKLNAVLPEKLGPEVAGQEVTLQVLVKEVKSKRLPTADDDFAKTASEFDSIAELRADIRDNRRAPTETESRAVVRD